MVWKWHRDALVIQFSALCRVICLHNYETYDTIKTQLRLFETARGSFKLWEYYYYRISTIWLHTPLDLWTWVKEQLPYPFQRWPSCYGRRDRSVLTWHDPITSNGNAHIKELMSGLLIIIWRPTPTAANLSVNYVTQRAWVFNKEIVNFIHNTN